MSQMFKKSGGGWGVGGVLENWFDQLKACYVCMGTKDQITRNYFQKLVAVHGCNPSACGGRRQRWVDTLAHLTNC